MISDYHLIKATLKYINTNSPYRDSDYDFVVDFIHKFNMKDVSENKKQELEKILKRKGYL